MATSNELAPAPLKASDPSLDVENAQQLKPPTKAELRARAAKEKKNLEAAKAKETEKNNTPVMNQTTRPRPRPKPTTEAECTALHSPNEDNAVPANVEVCAMSTPDESVVPPRRQRNLTDEGRRHAAEIAEKEAKRRARLQKVVAKEKKPATTTKKSRSRR